MTGFEILAIIQKRTNKTFSHVGQQRAHNPPCFVEPEAHDAHTGPPCKSAHRKEGEPPDAQALAWSVTPMHALSPLGQGVILSVLSFGAQNPARTKML